MRDNVTIGMGHTALHSRMDWFFASRGMGVNSWMLRRARLNEVIALEMASDAELAEMGLGRDDILQHVFGDLMG